MLVIFVTNPWKWNSLEKEYTKAKVHQLWVDIQIHSNKYLFVQKIIKLHPRVFKTIVFLHIFFFVSNWLCDGRVEIWRGIEYMVEVNMELTLV